MRRSVEKLWSSGERASQPAMNRHAVGLREPLLCWAQQTGLVTEQTMSAFDAVDSYAAFVHPAADFNRLLIIAQWTTLFFLFDDHVDQTAVTAIPAASWELLHNRHRIVSTGPDAPPEELVRSSPYARAFADLWSRSRGGLGGVGWQRRFAAEISHYQQAQIWELFNRPRKRFLDLTSFCETKRFSTQAWTAVSFIELFTPHPVPDYLLDSHVLRTMSAAALDLIQLSTDIISFDREIGSESLPSSIATLQTTLGYTLDQAFTHVEAVCSARASTLRQLHGDLPALLAHLRCSEADIAAACAWSNDLLRWTEGNFAWGAHTSRYSTP